MRLRSTAIFLILFLSSMVSCDKSAGDREGGRKYYSFSATIESNQAAGQEPSTALALVWSAGDRISVHTTSGAVRTFDLTSVRDDGVAVFGAGLPAGEAPGSVAVYPQGILSGVSDGKASLTWPASQTLGAVKVPMASAVSGDVLEFRQLGALLCLSFSSVPESAASLVLIAEGRKLSGTFDVPVGERMSVQTAPSDSDNSVSVSSLPSGGGDMDFTIPVPAGAYPSLRAEFHDAGSRTIAACPVAADITLSPAEVLKMSAVARTVIAGTTIDPACNRVGRITDSSTGAGIAGVPVTDGYTYIYTDARGVYQFTAHKDARCVYPSIPASYEIPMAPDGEPAFWKTSTYRNDWTLAPRTDSWEDFSVVAFSDVHFWNRGDSQSDEVDKYNAVTLPDINSYIAGLGPRVIVINTGDLLSNVPRKLAAARKEFAKIKKDGATVPMFPTIGNHDFNNASTSTLDCSADWFGVFGPMDYSFNLGRVHFVCMNNIQYSGNSVGGYGKAMEYDKGLTDAQWDWLRADLATVSDKAGTMLVLCVHAPVMNADWAHADDIRSVLSTFAESHIISGHSHYTVHRQFAEGKRGLSGRLAEEHNINPLGGLWRTGVGNDGSPNSYHVFHINGPTMSSQVFKAVGSPDASLQMRIYDGAASYHAPVADSYNGHEDIAGSGLVYFDWKTLWNDSEGFDTSDKLIVRVFDAGSRSIDINVYLNTGGVRTLMTPSTITHRDQCAFSYFWNGGDVKLNSSWAQAYWQNKVPAWWYGPKPSGSDWKVEVEFVEPAGVRRYESSTIQTDYSGLAW